MTSSESSQEEIPVPAPVGPPLPHIDLPHKVSVPATVAFPGCLVDPEALLRFDVPWRPYLEHFLATPGVRRLTCTPDTVLQAEVQEFYRQYQAVARTTSCVMTGIVRGQVIRVTAGAIDRAFGFVGEPAPIPTGDVSELRRRLGYEVPPTQVRVGQTKKTGFAPGRTCVLTILGRALFSQGRGLDSAPARHLRCLLMIEQDPQSVIPWGRLIMSTWVRHQGYDARGVPKPPHVYKDCGRILSVLMRHQYPAVFGEGDPTPSPLTFKYLSIHGAVGADPRGVKPGSIARLLPGQEMPFGAPAGEGSTAPSFDSQAGPSQPSTTPSSSRPRPAPSVSPARRRQRGQEPPPLAQLALTYMTTHHMWVELFQRPFDQGFLTAEHRDMYLSAERQQGVEIPASYDSRIRMHEAQIQALQQTVAELAQRRDAQGQEAAGDSSSSKEEEA